MSVTVKLVQNNLPQFQKALAALVKKQVAVGIQAGLPSSNSSATLAEVGYMLEEGSPLHNISPKPFLVPGIEKQIKESESLIKQGINEILLTPSGETLILETVLDKIGSKAVDSVRAELRGINTSNNTLLISDLNHIKSELRNIKKTVDEAKLEIYKVQTSSSYTDLQSKKNKLSVIRKTIKELNDRKKLLEIDKKVVIDKLNAAGFDINEISNVITYVVEDVTP